MFAQFLRSFLIILIVITIIACSRKPDDLQVNRQISSSNSSLIFEDNSFRNAKQKAEEEKLSKESSQKNAKEGRLLSEDIEKKRIEEEEERTEEIERLSPKGNIHDVQVDYNVRQNGRLGNLIHIDFDVENLKDVDCSANAYFYFTSGSPLKDFNSSYSTSDGKVASSTKFTPRYVDSHYADLQIFIPTDELHLDIGSHDLKFNVQLQFGNRNVIATSEYQYFTASIKSNPSLGEDALRLPPPSAPLKGLCDRPAYESCEKNARSMTTPVGNSNTMTTVGLSMLTQCRQFIQGCN